MSDPTNISESQLSEIRDLLKANRKIPAIKQARLWFGIGLKEAKELVEAIAAGRVAASSAPAGDLTQEAGHDPEITAALASGRKILAVKLIRERFGVGLREAKDAADALESSESVEPSASGPLGSAEAEIRQLLRSGRMIEAIKKAREVTGWGLREAKDAVDGLAREEGR